MRFFVWQNRNAFIRTSHAIMLFIG